MTYKSYRHYMRQNKVHLCHIIESNFIMSIWTQTISLFFVTSGVKRDTGPSQMHSFHFAEEHRGREGNLSPKLSVCPSLLVSNCVSLTPSSRLAWADVWLWPQEAVNSPQNGRCLMGRQTAPPPHTIPPTRHPKMTPDPFMCLYQAMEVRNSDESLWLCVYTPESRKEGNQPRSAKSGEVRENSCSPPELQWFTSLSQN